MNNHANTFETPTPLFSRIAIIIIVVIVMILLFLSTGPIGAGVILAVVLTVWRSMRQNRQQAFLLMLAESIERRIPLIPALQAFGEEYWFWQSRVRRLGVALANGIPLHEALRQYSYFMPLSSLPLIDAGQRAGRLNMALRLAAEQLDRSRLSWQTAAATIFYIFVVIFSFILIAAFVFIKILPALVKIFEEFDTNLPPLTQLLYDAVDFTEAFSPLILLVVVILFAAFIYGALCYVGLILCDLPGTRRMTRRLDTASVLDTLSFTVEAGQPMTGALAAMAADFPKRSVRRRLRQVWIAVAEGRDWIDGMIESKLLRPAEAGVLRAAIRADNLSWAMHELADSNRRRFGYRLGAVVQVLYPLTVFSLGMVVCFFVTACFLPLIKLIECLC